jgi:hypothetical protein
MNFTGEKNFWMFSKKCLKNGGFGDNEFAVGNGAGGVIRRVLGSVDISKDVL